MDLRWVLGMVAAFVLAGALAWAALWYPMSCEQVARAAELKARIHMWVADPFAPQPTLLMVVDCVERF